MAEILNFQKLTIKKMINKHIGFNQLEFEILLTVIKFLYAYIDDEFEDPIKEIQPNLKLKELFKNDKLKFANAFQALIDYWNINEIKEEECPIDNEFEKFPTVESLCEFIEKKVS